MHEYYLMIKSFNGDFFYGANQVSDNVDTIDVSVFSTDDFSKQYQFIAHGEALSPSRNAISDDGRLVATALWADYGKGDLFVFEYGKEILHLRKFGRVEWIKFHQNNKLLVGEGGKTYYIDIESQDIVCVAPCFKIFRNPFGEDIILNNRNTIEFDGKNVKGSTFSLFDVLGLEDGVVASEVGNCAVKYDYQGNKIWESATKQRGHIISMNYNPATRVLFGRAHDILAIDINTGEVIAEIENKTGIFVSKGDKELLIDYDCNCYEICNNVLRKISQYH